MRRRQRKAGADATVRGRVMGRRGYGWFTARRQMVAIGLFGTVLHLVLVSTALSALNVVNTAHADVARIAAAQADFQWADMAHDAMRADILLLVYPQLGGTAGGAVAELDQDVDEFRHYLSEVDEVDLPPGIEAELQRVRPLQEAYAASVLDVSRTWSLDEDAAEALLPELTEQYDALAVQQAAITEAMAAEVERRQLAADEAERSVRERLVGSAVAALLGMVWLTTLLDRLGGALADTLATQRGVAETLQHSLLPDRLPEVPGLRMAARYVSGAVGTEVGGDWYDVVPLPSGEVGLVMGDVVGHDLEAATSMGQLRNALRACAAEGADPEDVLQRLNRLCTHQGLGGMATVLYAVLDPVRGTLRVANAGHYPPLLVSGEERRFLESAPCPPVGAVRGTVYTSAHHELPPGSLVLMYTDGLVERRDVPVEAGMEQLRGLVDAPAEGDGLEDLCDTVLTGMLSGRLPEDDVAMLVVAEQATLGPHLELLLPAQAEQLSLLRGALERWLTEAGAGEEEVYEITVSCSEAATNAIEHAYGPGRADVHVSCDLRDGVVTITVRDWGHWREARGRDRGRGVRLMQGLMDEVDVRHGDLGTEVVMRRRLAHPADAADAANPRGSSATTQEVNA